MSESIRQSNLFTAEDYQKVFKAYSFIDYTAYDFDTLKQAMMNYIQAYYPEDFNDYIESSEFIAIIELIAYLGTSLAFRTDLNSRENFIDTATRRESIIRLAQMVNYVPRRNIAASGLFKISGLKTDQPLVDANGVPINDTTIFWNDPNNSDWFDQFIQIANAAFSSINPFGRPTKSGVIGGIPTDLYQLDSVTRLTVTYPISATVNGQEYPFDICNPNFITNENIFERDPNPDNSFNFIYRNDSLGVGSSNTGFFLLFKQGNLVNTDVNFDFPVPNRLYPIALENINQDDVYVQETDEDGTVINQWVKVPALAGENIIYNSIQFGERNIFDVISGANDTITVRFADGNFGNVPSGLFRFWTRTSANQNLIIRPDNIQGYQITIPYIGSDTQQYNLTVTFNLEQTIGNAAASETDEQIKLRAPEVFSTQSRMVNGSDYNVLPLVYGNQIAKLQAFNRTFSGQSRYLDLNDPTGFHKDLIIFGEDGALFRDNQNVATQVIEDSSNEGNIADILINNIQAQLRNSKLSTFYYDEYLPQFEYTIRVDPPNVGRSLLDLVPTVDDTSSPLYWKTSPAKFSNSTGYFVPSTSSTSADAAPLDNNDKDEDNIPNGKYNMWGFIDSGAILKMEDLQTVEVNNVINNGLPQNLNITNPYANIGPVELGNDVQINYQVTKVYPALRTTLTADEIVTVKAAIANGLPFYMYYDLMTDNWGCGTASSTNSELPFVYPSPNISATFTSDTGATSSSTTITVNDTSTVRVGMIMSVASGTGQFAPNTYVTGITSPTTFTVSVEPVVALADNAVVVGNLYSIYSTWDTTPTSGLLYVNITLNNEQNTTTFDITTRGRIFVFESYRDVRFYWEPNQAVIDNSTGLALKDSIEIMPLVNTNSSVDNNEPVIVNPVDAFLKEPVSFNISSVFTQDDGYVDSSKVGVSLVDNNNDGIPDNPEGFNHVVSPQDRVVFEYYTNEVTGYQSTRPWIAPWATDLENSTDNLYVYFPVNITGSDPAPTTLYSSPYIANMNLVNIYTTYISTTYTVAEITTFMQDPNNALVYEPNMKFVYMSNADLIFVNNLMQVIFAGVPPYAEIGGSSSYYSIANQLTAFFNNDTSTYDWIVGIDNITDRTDILTTYFFDKSYLLASISPPGYGVYYSMSLQDTLNPEYPSGKIVFSAIDAYHFDKNGKVFTQNTTIPKQGRLPLYFKWSHYSPIDQRIDPSPSNIVDMIAITNGYYRDMLIWKNSNGTLLTLPPAPTTEELRIQFQDLDKYKMVSDAMIWNSGSFKILFGTQASAELQATFKVVKAATSSISDNEVKTKVITAIDNYFDIRNWDFGEKFFYTELAAFIHQQLSSIISTVVIVPNNASSQFGNLFEIVAGPTELFMSTATVNNVQIVSNLTDANLRV